jgi:hypothetical protein
MRMVDFSPEHAIRQYNSQHASAVDVIVIRLGAGGVLGYHQAATNQLFVAIDGKGLVYRENPDELKPIRQGQAAFWER